MIRRVAGVSWRILSEEFSVAKSNSSRTIYSNHILVKLSDLYYNACLIPLSGVGPCLILDSNQVSNGKGGRCLVCSESRSAVFMCLLRNASSLASSVSFHVGWGAYRPGWIGIKSRMGRPKRHCAGDSLVCLSGVFRY